MNDKELAEMARKIVGEVFDDWEFDAQFVRDWRVAGALMEKMSGKDLLAAMEKILKAIPGPLPRAIIEACVAALNGGE